METDSFDMPQSSVSAENRYARQLLLPEIGAEGQARLRAARVLLVGAGGLGAPVALALAGAGVGCLGIVDDDVVGLTNLHRQLLYDETLVGQPKVHAAACRLRRLNGEVLVEPWQQRLTPLNAEALVARYDLVVDGCDNFATRYLLDDVCHRLGRPYVFGAVSGFEGQAAVFNVPGVPCRYRDLFPEPPAAGEGVSEATAEPSAASVRQAVVGMTPGVVGNVMAHEALKLICGYGRPLAGRLWTVDLRTMETQLLDLV